MNSTMNISLPELKKFWNIKDSPRKTLLIDDSRPVYRTLITAGFIKYVGSKPFDSKKYYEITESGIRIANKFMSGSNI